MSNSLGQGSRAGEVLALVHRSPGLSRAGVCETLGLSSGLASDVVARLVGAAWLAEGDPVPGSGRGRPTRTLWPHPDGPLVMATAIFHENWHVEVCEIGGAVLDSQSGVHDREPAGTLAAVGDAMSRLWHRHGARLRAIGIAVPGTVSGTRLVQAPNLGWEDVELAALRPVAAVAADIPLHAGNDANDSAVAERARGAAEGVDDVLLVFMDSGVGGALVDGGRITAGAHGMSGEFGHLPLGSRRIRCRCGALGCWNTELDGAALARALRRPLPADEVTFSRRVLATAREAPGPERRAVSAIARALGRGTAGLVNACDPALVVYSGLAAEVLSVAPGPLASAYREGLMSTRATAAPRIVAGALGERAPLVGAMEAAFSLVLASPAV